MDELNNITEDAKTIGGLDPTQPTGGQPVSVGDNHIREFKKSVKNSLGGWEGLIYVRGTVESSSTASHYAVSVPLSDDLIVDSAKAFKLFFVPKRTNADSCVISIYKKTENGIEAISGLQERLIYSTNGVNIAAGALKANIPVELIFDGQKMVVASGNDKPSTEDIATREYVDEAITQAVFDGIVPGTTGRDGDVVSVANEKYVLGKTTDLPDVVKAFENADAYTFFMR